MSTSEMQETQNVSIGQLRDLSFVHFEGFMAGKQTLIPHFCTVVSSGHTRTRSKPMKTIILRCSTAQHSGATSMPSENSPQQGYPQNSSGIASISQTFLKFGQFRHNTHKFR